MATLKGAYQRFVSSIIRLWKREEQEDNSNFDDTEKPTNSSSELLSDVSSNDRERELEATDLKLTHEKEESQNKTPDIFVEDSDKLELSPLLGKKKTNLRRGFSLLKLSQTKSTSNLPDVELQQQITERQRNNSSPTLNRKLSTTNLLHPSSASNIYQRRGFLRRDQSASHLYQSSSQERLRGDFSTSNLLRDHPPVVLRRNLGSSNLQRISPVILRRESSVSNLFRIPGQRPEKKKRPKSTSDFSLEQKSEKEIVKPYKSSTPQPSPVRKETSKNLSPEPQQQTSSPRLRTLTIASRFSKFASKHIDGTIRRRAKSDAKRKVMEEIETGKDKKMPADPFLARLRDYNTYYGDKPTLQFKWKQDKNGNLLVDGMLNIYWGLKRSIRLQMADGGVKIRPQSQLAYPQAEAVRKFDVMTTGEPINEENVDIVLKNETLSGTLRRKLSKVMSEPKIHDDDEVISVENGILGDTRHRAYDRRRMALRLKNGGERVHVNTEDSDGFMRQKSVILRKRLTNKNSRKRFSINGHAYNYETSVFTPAYASVTNVRVTSKHSCDDVIKHLLNKFRVENSFEEFSLYLVKESGERRELSRNEYPLITRVLSGPNEQVCKIFVMDRHMHDDISSDVAQYFKLDLNILTMFVKKFTEEEERETKKMRERYEMYGKMLKKRIEELSET